ncbi:hypothetical protein JOB18_016460 [Solea senegalensis]|uniref:Uncharacterized protein n=1 Tax=Solea senegalensis TaxID=28829 RepID=A0AAV6QP15_SOLSE|nr:hypothetical protein JOB18_016460 [Solea senegalensis]
MNKMMIIHWHELLMIITFLSEYKCGSGPEKFVLCNFEEPQTLKTKSELPVSGWSTDCGEREGGGGRRRGCAFPHWLCSQLQGALRDSTAEHGVQFCHRSSAQSDCGEERHGEASVSDDKVSVSVKNSSHLHPSASATEKKGGEGEALLENQTFHTVLGPTELFPRTTARIESESFNAEYSCINLRSWV